MVERTCRGCGAPFTTASGGDRYCPGCRIVEKTCRGCGSPFTVKVGNRRRVYCSTSCVDDAKGARGLAAPLRSAETEIELADLEARLERMGAKAAAGAWPGEVYWSRRIQRAMVERSRLLAEPALT